jgi:hypothetical protein
MQQTKGYPGPEPVSNGLAGLVYHGVVCTLPMGPTTLKSESVSCSMA